MGVRIGARVFFGGNEVVEKSLIGIANKTWLTGERETEEKRKRKRWPERDSNGDRGWSGRWLL